jgi:amicyanin
MSRSLALLLACLSLGLVAAGCGGDDDDDGGGGAAETTEQPADTAAEDTGGAGGETVEVGMKGIQFDPDSVTVKAGGTVKWTNNESVPHDVTKEDGPGAKFSSGTGNMKQGDTYEQTFKEAGTVNYVCTVHPNMKGTVTVE